MPVNLKDPIQFFLKDPTRHLVKSIPIPPYTAQMPFMVIGFDGGGKEPDTYAGRAAVCYYVLATSVPAAIIKLGKTPRWSSTETLMIQPAAGRMLNANYDRRYLNFYFAWDAVRSQWVYSSGAIDVIAHELGHALIDAIRPDFWNLSVPEVGALHEGIADIHAFTTLMRQKEVMVFALISTGGNLYKSNIISRLGEEMGRLHTKSDSPLRDASNSFVYVNPTSLPPQAPPDQLSTEPHSLSRVISGAAYEIMVGIYLKLVSQGIDGLVALQTAGEVLMTYTFKALTIMAANVLMFQSFSKALVLVDQQAGGPYADVLYKVLVSRNLIPAVSMMGLIDKIDVTLSRRVVSPSEVLEVSSLSYNPLHNVKFHIPLDETRSYDAQGNLVEEHVPDPTVAFSHMQTFADHLTLTDRVGEGKEFRILHGTLTRNHISCCKG